MGTECARTTLQADKVDVRTNVGGDEQHDMSAAKSQPAAPKPERRRPQFSLAALLVGMTVVCVWLAILKMIGRGWPLLVFLTAYGFLAIVYFRIFPRASGYGFGLVLLVANVVVAAVVTALIPFPQIAEWFLGRW